MVQYDREDLQAGLRWFDMTPPEWQDVHAREEAEELARTGKMQAREKEYFRKDGSRVPVLIGAACFEGQSRQGVAYILDLTERKRAEAAQLRAEEALRQASDELAKATQAASLAELSASIAHEVNQPLAAIVANSHACHRWLSAEPPNLERAKITAERIIRDANSAADVVSRIRALFKQSTETGSTAALSSAIAEALELMAEEAARRRVRIDTDIEGDLPRVALDRVQVQQVLINLMRNGIEAMDVHCGRQSPRPERTPDGDVVQTEISDRGRGVEFPDRIFEPFFTTKEQGMGMGLAICRSIVESHGGRLWAEKNEPHGAKFIFTLPVEVKAGAMTTDDHIVFIVDDDARIREALGELLASHGMRAVAFGSAGDYVGAEKPDVPSCLILDVELPDINGLDLQRQIAEGNHPPIVFITGHGDIPSSVRAIKHGAVDFLTKPFSDAELMAAIHAAIAQDREKRSARAELGVLRQRYLDLTPREREVLPLVVSGLLNKQAAAELGISEVTLQIHRRNVMQKMEAASLADLVRIAERLEIPITHSRRAGGN